MEEKTVEYCFDSNIYSGEDIKAKIEEIKREFSKISNKPIVARVELNELGMYILSFKVYEKRKIAKAKPEKINKVYIESLNENSDGYINKLIDNKDDKYIKKLKRKEQEQEKESVKMERQQEIIAKRELEKQQKKREKILREKFKRKNYAKVGYIRETKYNSTSRIEFLDDDVSDKTFTEKINDFIQMLKNIKLPKLDHHIDENNDRQIGEKHYWSDNYIPKQYGKYKETKKYKPL